MRSRLGTAAILSAAFSVCAGGGYLQSNQAYADIILFDGFSPANGTPAQDGKVYLNGKPVEVGSGSWSASRGYLTESGTVVSLDNVTYTARTSFTAPTGILQVEISATLGNASWLGFGILSADTTKGWWDANGSQLWLLVNSGGWSVVANGGNYWLGSGSLASLDSDWVNSAHTFALQYDPGLATVQVLMDGVIVSDTAISTTRATISVGGAGFYVNVDSGKTTDSTSIDSFQVVAVPEVASLSLLSLAGLLQLGRRRR